MLLGIFPVGDPTERVTKGTDLVVLEEPEHIAWFHCGPQWTEKFDHVVRTPCKRLGLFTHSYQMGWHWVFQKQCDIQFLSALPLL